MIEYPEDPIKSGSAYIDRPRFWEGIQRLLKIDDAKHIVLGDTHAIYGSGKTTVLSRLFHELKAEGEWVPIWLPLDRYSIFRTNNRIEEFTSLEALKQNFDDFKRLLSDLGDQINPDAFEELPRTLEEITGNAFEDLFKIDVEAYGGRADIGSLAKIVESEIKGGDVNIDISVANQPELLGIIISSKQKLLAEEFQKIFKPLSQKSRFVLFADDFCWIIDQFIGDWFLQLVGRLNHTITLISRTKSESLFRWDEHNLVHLWLDSFTKEEVHQYMRKRNLDLSSQQVKLIFRYSKGGHPLLVSLAGDLLGRLNRRQASDVDDILERLVGGDGISHATHRTISPIPLEEDELRESIEKIIDELRNDLMKYDLNLLQVLDLIAVAREFDQTLFEFMFLRNMQGQRETKDESLQLIAERFAVGAAKRLPEYSVVEMFHRPSQKTQHFRVHYLVREVMYVNLIKEEGVEYVQRLHSLLVDYYAEKESKYLEGQGVYKGMFRLEHPSWQRDRLEWLYHLFHLHDRDQARVNLCRLYLEAFDWWGWYKSFDFLNDLLDSWEHTQPHEDLGLINLLRSFQLAYPSGYDKHGKGSWEETYKVLQNIKAHLKLTQLPENMESSRRMVRGHLDRFSADALRFHKLPRFDQAEVRYRSSLDYFEADWNKMWITNYLAELNLDWGLNLEEVGEIVQARDKYRQAEELARQANQMALEEPDTEEQDHELISQNYRILGETFRHQSRWGQTFQAYLRMIAHSYIFYFIDSNLDEYSYEFYYDTGGQVINSLVAIAQRDRPDIARQAVEYMRSFWIDKALFYADSILTPIADDFGLEEILLAGDREGLKHWILPIIPPVGTEDDSLRIGVAVSQTIAEIIEDDLSVPVPEIC